MENALKWLISFFGTIFIFVLGGFDIALQTLLCTIVLDFLTGISKAYVNKNLNSSYGFRGIVKKVAILCLVALATMIDHITGDSGFVRTTIIYYLVANEGLSIIENLGEMGILVPDFLKERLEQLKKGEENHD